MNICPWYWNRLITALLLAGSLTFTGSLAYAAPSSENDTPLVQTNPTLIEHLRTEIRDRDPDRRESALVDVIALAACQTPCTVQMRSFPGESIRIADAANTLAGLGPDLFRAYRSGPTDQHRLLALSALINIGNAKALEQLIDEGARQSEGVNRTTQRSLAAFYLQKYPELRNRTLRSGQISLYDVRRAEALRVKRAKKAAKDKG